MFDHCRKLVIILLASLWLAACGGGNSDSGSSIAFPRLVSTPVLSTGLISSATGGNLTVSLQIAGDVSNIKGISIVLMPSAVDGDFPDGFGLLLDPVSTDNDIEIVLEAGAPEGVYYPLISFALREPVNAGNSYFRIPFLAETHYTYAETATLPVDQNNLPTPIQTEFVIPTITITP